MTREEEKKKARWEYVSKRLAIPDFPTYNAEYELEAAFDEGAQWADAHPQWEKIVKRLQKEITNDLRKDMKVGEVVSIDKACEWLRECAEWYVNDLTSELIVDDLINAFRKAMKGEQI